MTERRTELLRLSIPLPGSVALKDVQSWALSLGTALRIGIRHLFMLDGSEIDFEFEGPWTETVEDREEGRLSLTFIDPSIGGTGYLERAAQDLHLVARRAIEHLDHQGCETACYRCLKSYTNQRYHDALSWPMAVPYLEALAEAAPQRTGAETGDRDEPGPWLEAYAAGVGSPLELRFLRLFEQHGFTPQKQVPVSPQDGASPISVADFAVPERRLAIYVDGASVHVGHVLRRDRYIRERLRAATPPWTVVELRAADLGQGKGLVERLKSAD